MSPDLDINNGNNVFESALQHVTRKVPMARRQQTVAQLRAALLGGSYDCASHVVVCDGELFAGILRIEDLITAHDDNTVDALMDREVITVRPGVDQEKAAWHATQHGESALAVVDDAGRFVGLIPPYTLLAVLLQEHDEDIARAAGVLLHSLPARNASEEPLGKRYWHRLPWLLVGLAGALLAADIVGWFEARLQQKLMLAFFIPGIVYLADAVGTQTETLVVRGLSLGVSIRKMLKLELLTGFGIGATLSLVATPIIYWRWHDWEVAASVGLAIFASCSTATFVALLLPWLFERRHIDPAFGSGPLATVMQDLLSVLMYFAVVTLIIV